MRTIPLFRNLRGGQTSRLLLAVVAALSGLAYSQAPEVNPTPTPQARPQGRGQGMGPEGRGRGAGPGGASVAELIFEEGWVDLPMAEPITQQHLSNENLVLHIYGDSAHIRASNHRPDFYTYTGETVTNWALTVSDPEYYYDLSGNGRMMLRTRNSGFRRTHIVIKTLEGQWFASEEGNPESSAWINRDYVLSDLHWRELLMTDTPTNASNQREPDPDLVPIIPLGPGHPDLSQVDEVGFSDLLPGGWIPATSRVNVFAVYGRKVKR